MFKNAYFKCIENALKNADDTLSSAFDNDHDDDKKLLKFSDMTYQKSLIGSDFVGKVEIKTLILRG
ncbi:hypothetical protein BpHYR1_003761 [Brachionus plicatilis]|uniref:Uncharacterized protein n=1 Tax=Brachionus plicatilis TaxID=10195 RepID=A0A3M7SNW4_BRAPC|nr:hypothetical protein BpHYR1_003761 [Brachionus plicatilis]